MKKLTLALVFALTATSFSSCATTHLWRWGLRKTSAIHTIKNETVDAIVRPQPTILATPAAVAFDVVTLPFQLIFRVYPYFDQDVMRPSERRQ